MAIFKITQRDLKRVVVEKKPFYLLKKKKFNEFNEAILGLGDIHTKPTKIDALSAIFDLEGFTNFCNQRDPELNVSLFLNDFLVWIFKEIKTPLIENEFEDGYLLYSNLPFLSKYLGDGILFLWNTENLDDRQICNSIVVLSNVCKKYKKDFLPEISKKMVAVPTNLRCGVAKGTVFSVGNGNDYVGSCINVSARLQKLHNLPFCFSTIGIDYNKGMLEKTKTIFIQKKVLIRGIGEEFVCIRKKDFENLSEEDKKYFVDI